MRRGRRRLLGRLRRRGRGRTRREKDLEGDGLVDAFRHTDEAESRLLGKWRFEMRLRTCLTFGFLLLALYTMLGRRRSRHTRRIAISDL